jgi:hypothetical protein
VVALLVLSLVLKRDFLGLLGGGEGPAGATSGEVTSSPEEEKLVEFGSGRPDACDTFRES